VVQHDLAVVWQPKERRQTTGQAPPNPCNHPWSQGSVLPVLNRGSAVPVVH
jgi:hypothetical protein